MSMRIAALNGKCPCQRCQHSKSDQDLLLASLGLVGQRAGMKPGPLSLGTQVRLLMARMTRQP